MLQYNRSNQPINYFLTLGELWEIFSSATLSTHEVSLTCTRPLYCTQKHKEGVEQRDAEDKWLDMHLTMTVHVVNLIRPANSEVRRINSIRHNLSVQATKTLCFHFCSFTAGLLQFPPFRMPPVLSKQTSKGSQQCSPLHLAHLRTLHWLPIDARIKYKLCSLCFGAITSTGPVYLSIYSRFTHSQSNSDFLQTSL